MTPSAHNALHAAWLRGSAAQPGIWRPLLLACAVTAGLFLFMPLSDLLLPLPEAAPRTALVDTVAPPPALPPPPAPAPTRTAHVQATMPTPRLMASAQAAPSAAPLRVDLSLGTMPADVIVNFAIAPEISLATGGDDLIFDVSETDRMPQPLARLTPMYPPQARLRRIEGDVVVEFLVGPDGTVSAAAVVQAQPPSVFDQTALQAIQRWRFEPGLKDGQPVTVRVRQKLTFKLEE